MGNRASKARVGAIVPKMESLKYTKKEQSFIGKVSGEGTRVERGGDGSTTLASPAATGRERCHDGVTKPELPEGPQLQDLFTMIHSRPTTFASQEEVLKRVPDKSTAEALKKGRLQTRDARLLLEDLSRAGSSGAPVDVNRLAAAYGIHPDLISRIMIHCELPKIMQTGDGRLIASKT